jgi:hypothetical protein
LRVEAIAADIVCCLGKQGHWGLFCGVWGGVTFVSCFVK